MECTIRSISRSLALSACLVAKKFPPPLKATSTNVPILTQESPLEARVLRISFLPPPDFSSFIYQNSKSRWPPVAILNPARVKIFDTSASTAPPTCGLKRQAAPYQNRLGSVPLPKQ